MIDLQMPGRGIQHADLAVSDVDRSLAFYMDLLGPLGLKEEERYATYRGTEEVVYLSFGDEWIGLRPADGGTHRYYGVGLEHLAFEVDTREEVDAHQRCSRRAIGSTTRRSRAPTSRATTHSSSSIPMASASRSSVPGGSGPRASTVRSAGRSERKQSLDAPRETRTPTDQMVHKALNLARLPIPPQARGGRV